jgi:hypothetical protein
MAMSNDNIIRIFKSDEGPGLSPEAKQRIIRAASAEYARAQTAPRRMWFPALSAVAAAAAIVILAMNLFHAAPLTEAEREKKVLAEFNQVFAGRLQAVITTGGKTEIVLSENDAPHGQPVMLRLNAEGQDIDVMSFSGQNVNLSVGGRQVSFDTLIDGKGGVILVGKDILWQDGKAVGTPSLNVKKAEALEM